jgi:hypothetical protein
MSLVGREEPSARAASGQKQSVVTDESGRSTSAFTGAARLYRAGLVE